MAFLYANLHEADFEALFRSLRFERTRIEVRQVPDQKPQGHDSILLVSGYEPLNTF